MEKLDLHDLVHRLDNPEFCSRYEGESMSVMVLRRNPNDPPMASLQLLDLGLTGIENAGVVLHRAVEQREAPTYTLPELLEIFRGYLDKIISHGDSEDGRDVTVKFVGRTNPFDHSDDLDDPEALSDNITVTHGGINDYGFTMRLAREGDVK